MEFKEIDINSKEVLDKYFDLVDYEACEYCFNTLFMWQHTFKTCYHIGEDFAVLVGEHEGELFSILPLARKEKIKEAIEYAIEWFDDDKKRIYFRGVDLNVVEILKKMYPDKFDYIEERDIFDYIYSADKLKYLKGRKFSSKRNHLNYFNRTYGNMVDRRLLDKDDFDDCLKLLKKWNQEKSGDEDFENSVDDEFIGIKKMFDNYDKLKDKLKVYGIFIDGKLEAFSMGEKLKKDTALIHIEKANSNIRGLYPYINKMFLLDEFPDVKWVNREDDMGVKGLRRAKMSYQPDRFVEKYMIREK